MTPQQVSEGSGGVESEDEDEVGWVDEARSAPPEQAWARPHWEPGSPHHCLPVSRRLLLGQAGAPPFLSRGPEAGIPGMEEGAPTLWGSGLHLGPLFQTFPEFPPPAPTSYPRRTAPLEVSGRGEAGTARG